MKGKPKWHKVSELCEAKCVHVCNMEVYAGQQPIEPDHISFFHVLHRLCEPTDNKGCTHQCSARSTLLDHLQSLTCRILHMPESRETQPKHKAMAVTGYNEHKTGMNKSIQLLAYYSFQRNNEMVETHTQQRQIIFLALHFYTHCALTCTRIFILSLIVNYFHFLLLSIFHPTAVKFTLIDNLICSRKEFNLGALLLNV
jgi:hypothetical protein